MNLHHLDNYFSTANCQPAWEVIQPPTAKCEQPNNADKAESDATSNNHTNNDDVSPVASREHKNSATNFAFAFCVFAIACFLLSMCFVPWFAALSIGYRATVFALSMTLVIICAILGATLKRTFTRALRENGAIMFCIRASTLCALLLCAAMPTPPFTLLACILLGLFIAVHRYDAQWTSLVACVLLGYCIISSTSTFLWSWLMRGTDSGAQNMSTNTRGGGGGTTNADIDSLFFEL